MTVLGMLWAALWRSLLSWTPSAAVRHAWTIYQRSPALLPRRSWLMRLGLSPLGGLLVLAIQGVLIYGLSMAGFFAPLAQQGFGQEPAEWVLWSASAGLPNVLAQAGVSFLFVCLIPFPYLLSGFAWVLAFPGFISTLGFAAVVLAERWALRTMLIVRDPLTRLSGRAEWFICWIAQGLAMAALFGVGMMAKEQALLWVGPVSEFQPGFRFLMGYFLVFIFVALEIFINMIVLHFLHLRSRGE